MSFKDLLKAKDEAEAFRDECAQALQESKAAFDSASEDAAEAVTALENAHKAIRDLLTEKGHHSIAAKDGTVTVYHATDKVPEGWAGYHPIPGEAE
jgi:cellobiose-specific phosphotransferase system component IIA